MPSYGSLHSPSLRKMENSRAQYGRKGMRMGNIIGDPFALATLSISALAWVIVFFASIFAQVRGSLPSYYWFGLVFHFFLIVGIFVVVASDTIQTYHVAIVGYLGCAVVLSTSIVNNQVYSNAPANQAVAAGYILLTMVTIIWIFYFGSAPSAVPRAYIDSFALAKESTMQSHNMAGGYTGGRPETSTSVQPPQMYTQQLNGLENPSPVGGMTSTMRNSNVPPAFPSAPTAPKPAVAQPNETTDAQIVPPTEYPYRAKAIYSYEANPDDANEISFSKHEILEVSDVSGRWWQARKENGDTGIAPSNYLILL
ncbi:high osmolarity signaling protein SHO1 [Apodospora peruviana]|uniref:High osmolarity signaling protein SHO1 n=1 Tax=Apodospora peruviana TaxID=516989 RepID=A0AAE0IVR5_9PEZI|nr:high osmolarity signaling protein SHO1 [Apodospora peruviana]